jgi:hypothetical protein
MWIANEGQVVDWTNTEFLMDDGRDPQTTEMRRGTHSIDRMTWSTGGNALFFQVANRTISSHTGETTTLRRFDFEQG